MEFLAKLYPSSERPIWYGLYLCLLIICVSRGGVDLPYNFTPGHGQFCRLIYLNQIR
jgi:hypothetical protein